jgi:RNA polymerase sigma-70 factor, ECF subfamily
MSEHKPQSGKVLGVVLSSHQDNSPGLLTASQTLVEGDTWTPIVERIRGGDAAASEELYPKILPILKSCCKSRLVPDESEDRMQETYLIVLKAIQNGDVREPEKLMGFIRVIGHRQYCAYIHRRTTFRSSESDIEAFESSCRFRFDPEFDVLVQERRAFAQGVLAQLAPREREILERFYIREESPDWICKAMALTSDQFRLLKWRAKAKVTVTAKKSLRVTTFRSSLRRANRTGSGVASIGRLN